VFNIKNDEEIKASNGEETPDSIDKTEAFQNDGINDFNEDNLVQNLKNYIDCNVDGMEYNENLKK
jgi:hypothetical protein